MINHLLVPGFDLSIVNPIEPYEYWLKNWLETIESDLEDGDIASSVCLQAMMSEIVVYKELRYDWVGILGEYLTDPDGFPLAYSEAYGQRLFLFDRQWRQTPIHAVHTHFWMGQLYEPVSDGTQYSLLITDWIQPSGWIFNPNVSPTNLNTRMNSEYLLSTAMGLEILSAENDISQYEEQLLASISSKPLMPYLSAEYFRTLSLEILREPNLAPKGLSKTIIAGEAGKAYCDFGIESKVDDYMGSKKITGRDKAVHSAISTLHAAYLAKYLDVRNQERVKERIKGFRKHLFDDPMDIPAFRIRDIIHPFGTGISPLEIISASIIAQGLVEELFE